MAKVLQPPLWQPPAQHLIELKQVYGVLEAFTKEQTALLNQKQALQLMPGSSSKALAAIDEQLASLQASMADLEKHLDQLLQQHYQHLHDGLQSIPGIGPTSALLLMVVSQGFQAFENANQLIAYLGLAPRIDQSGKTVLKNHINKQGAARLRKVLYMAAWSAKRFNKACRELYQRRLQKGKPTKVALNSGSQQTHQTSFCHCQSQNQIPR
jgi:transposase